VDRRAFIGSLTGGLLAAPFAAEAQPTGKVYQIGYVSLGAAPTRPEMFHFMLEALREQNYVLRRQDTEGR
jgi:hypothetical protein